MLISPFTGGFPRLSQVHSHNANGVKLPCFEEGKIPIFRIGALLILINMTAFSFLYGKFCCGRISLHFSPGRRDGALDRSNEAGKEWDAARKAGRYFTGIRISCKHKHLAWRVMRRMKTGHRSFLNETLNL